MRRHNISYAAFRYFIIADEQISFFNVVEERRQEAVEKFFKSIESKKKLTCKILNKKHILVFNRKINNDLYIYKFSNEVDETIYKERDTDIENIVEQNFPFVYLIIDIKHQIILIEIKTSVYRSVVTTKNKLQKFLDINFYQYGFNVVIEEITDEKNFWGYIDEADGIYEVSLKLNSPNLFGGKIDTDEMLKEVQKEYNNTNLTFKLFSEKAKLLIKRENRALLNALKYIAGGAGEWSLTTLTRGNKKTYKSNHSIKKVLLKNIDNIHFEDQHKFNEDVKQAITSVENVLVENEND